MDKAMKRKQDLLNLCKGMDELDIHKKEKCLSFSEAMLSLEGMKYSDDVFSALEQWEVGRLEFLSIYQFVLKQYGFIK